MLVVVLMQGEEEITLLGQVKGRSRFLVVTSLCRFFNSLACTHQRNKWLT